jgi:DNA-binding protein H-NS
MFFFRLLCQLIFRLLGINVMAKGSLSVEPMTFIVNQLGQLATLYHSKGQLEDDITALKRASKTLNKLLESQNIDVEEIVSDFKITRNSGKAPNKRKINATSRTESNQCRSWLGRTLTL